MANHLPFLYIGKSKLGGRGVFTSEPIAKGTPIEMAPVIVLDETETKMIHETRLHDYYFIWNETGSAIALGYGGLYNHLSNNNVDYYMDYDFNQINFFALRDIEAGEELTINYTDPEDERTRLWF